LISFSKSYRNWGDVSENQGLQVLAASNLILLAIIVGIVILQGGMWYTKWEYQKRLTAHNLEIKKEEQEKLAKQQEKDVPPVATTTATVPKTKGKAKSKK